MGFIEVPAPIACKRTLEGVLRRNGVPARRELMPAAGTRTMVAPLKHSLAVVTDGWTIALFGHRFSYYRNNLNQLILSGSRFGSSIVSSESYQTGPSMGFRWQRLYDIAISRSQFMLRFGLLTASFKQGTIFRSSAILHKSDGRVTGGMMYEAYAAMLVGIV